MRDFEVLQGDLDADGRDEIIVVNLSGESQGMGQQYRDVAVLATEASGVGIRRSAFGVEEYGAEGTFVRLPGRQGIRLFVTEWEWNDRIDPSRGQGLYLVGRWLEYRNTSLAPISDPVLVRRYLSSFERERNATLGRPENPYAWFDEGKARSIALDPMTMTPEIASTDGTIEEMKIVQNGPDNGPLKPHLKAKFNVRLESGRNVDVSLGVIDKDQLPLDESNTFTRFGLAEGRFVLPRTVEPYEVIGNLVGKQITLSTFRGLDDQHVVRIMWIHNANPQQ